MQLSLGPWPCTLCALFCGWGEELLPLAGCVLCRQNRARSLSLQLGERPHSSWHWREWQQLTWDRMWPWLPVWPHPPAVVMWQCTLVYCAFILLLSCYWSWTSMPSKYLHFSLELALIRAVHPVPGMGPGSKDFSESYPTQNRNHWPRTCLAGKENYIAAPCIYSQSYFQGCILSVRVPSRVFALETKIFKKWPLRFMHISPPPRRQLSVQFWLPWSLWQRADLCLSNHLISSNWGINM